MIDDREGDGDEIDGEERSLKFPSEPSFVFASSCKKTGATGDCCLLLLLFDRKCFRRSLVCYRLTGSHCEQLLQNITLHVAL